MARPLTRFFALFAYVGSILVVDSRWPSLYVQGALGLATFAVLFLYARDSDETERRQMWICVIWSTAVELTATQAMHIYGYQLGNVPLYVPPGHGLIFLAAQQLCRSPWLRAHGRPFAFVVLGFATLWAMGGLILPARPDVHGAAYWPFFVFFTFKSKDAPSFAATFLITSFIELFGVYCGTWHWAEYFPYLNWPSGDPPSLIAGGYCSFAVAAALIDRALFGSRKQAPSLVHSPP